MAFVVECGLKIENKKSKFKDETDRRALSIDSLKERTKRNQLTVIKDLVDEESDSDEAKHDSLLTNNGWTLDKKIKKKM